MPKPEPLASFVSWYQKHITGDEKGQAQIFLDRLFQGFGLSGSLGIGGTAEFRIRKSTKTAAERLLPICQAFDYWTRLVPNRPRYVVLGVWNYGFGPGT